MNHEDMTALTAELAQAAHLPAPTVVIDTAAPKNRPIALSDSMAPVLLEWARRCGSDYWSRVITEVQRRDSERGVQLLVHPDYLRDAPYEVIRAITAHELGHLHLNQRLTGRTCALLIGQRIALSLPVIATLAAGTVGSLAFQAAGSSVLAWGTTAIVFLIAVPAVAVAMAGFAHSRRGEYAADRFGVGVVGSEAMVKGIAWTEAWQHSNDRLSRIKPPQFMSTHPATRNRVRALS